MIYILPTDTCFWLACALSDKKEYHKIYKLKKRDWSKPLALMVENYDWLREHTDLTDEQIEFLEEYEKPFTVLTHSDRVKMYIDYDDSDEWDFLNSDVYNEIAFRVAHMPTHHKLIKREWPIFLTSANRSGQWEIFDIETIENMFWDDKYVEIRAEKNLHNPYKHSDIFRFIWDTTEVEYIREG